MRIAHLTWSLGIGGIQTMLTEIANIQIQHGHEVGIFVVDTYVSEKIVEKFDPKVRIYYLGRTRGKKALLPFIRLNWYLWRYKPDIIHSHAGKLIRIVFSQKPAVATIHGPNCNPKDYKKYKSVYAISKFVQQEWIDKWGIRPILVENGIDCKLIKTRAIHDLSKEIHIVQVSRIMFDPKGQDILVKSFGNLINRLQNDKINHYKKCFLHFVGDGLDFEKLKILVKDYGIEEYVVFEGFKDPRWVHEHLCDYDLFVQPSRREGFGLTVAEACAAKVPVLVSDIDGPLEIIDGGRLGMTFKCGDINDLADKLYQFVHKGFDDAMVDEAYRYTCEHFDIHRTTQKYMNEYKKMLADR